MPTLPIRGGGKAKRLGEQQDIRLHHPVHAVRIHASRDDGGGLDQAEAEPEGGRTRDTETEQELTGKVHDTRAGLLQIDTRAGGYRTMSSSIKTATTPVYTAQCRRGRAGRGAVVDVS
jgi:hypothetical protein